VEKGFEITGQPENADLILFNTCSVRERAQEKVFHDLGRVKHLKQARPDLLIGVELCREPRKARPSWRARPKC